MLILPSTIALYKLLVTVQTKRWIFRNGIDVCGSLQSLFDEERERHVMRKEIKRGTHVMRREIKRCHMQKEVKFLGKGVMIKRE